MAEVLEKLNNALLESDLYQKAVAYYQSLSERDQFAVRMLLGFFAIVVLFFMIVFPAQEYSREAAERAAAAQETINWMKANESKVKSAAASAPKRAPGQSLISIATATAGSADLSFKRYEPVGEDGLNLWLEGVSFNNLVTWLEQLEKQYGVTVQEISVDRQESDGVVNARLLLEG